MISILISILMYWYTRICSSTVLLRIKFMFQYLLNWLHYWTDMWLVVYSLPKSQDAHALFWRLWKVIALQISKVNLVFTRAMPNIPNHLLHAKLFQSPCTALTALVKMMKIPTGEMNPNYIARVSTSEESPKPYIYIYIYIGSSQ